MNIPANPYIVANSCDFLFSHALLAHRPCSVRYLMIHVKDKAIRIHHHIVTNNSSIRDMGIDANAGVVTDLYVNSRSEKSFTLYIHVFATFLKDMLTDTISNTPTHIEKSI